MSRGHTLKAEKASLARPGRLRPGSTITHCRLLARTVPPLSVHPRNVGQVSHWRNRRQLLTLGDTARSGPPKESLLPDAGTVGLSKLRVSVYKADNPGQTPCHDRDLGLFSEPPKSDLRRLGIAERRWRGMIGPSLYMTAVEAAPPQEGSREHGERCGREARRVMALGAAGRAINDLPPWRPLEEALADPGPRLRELMAEAQREALDHGNRQERESALAWLKLQSPYGLDPYAKFPVQTQTHGFKGLTVAGRRSIRDGCRLLADHAGTLAFGTLTLPDDVAETCSRDQIATFQSRWTQYARELLIRRGLPPLVVIVAEFHPNRKTLGGGPIVHWHWCAPVSPAYGERWTARVGDWHGINRAAFKSAFGRARGNDKGCRVEGAKTNPGKYLSKYLSKTMSNCQRFIGTHWERCVPKQWWGWTGELRELVKACRIKPPTGFLSWCCRWAKELVDQEQCTSELIQIGEDGPIVGRWFSWASPEALDRAIETWLAEELARLDELRGIGPPLTG